jgi:hypothetical protein
MSPAPPDIQTEAPITDPEPKTSVPAQFTSRTNETVTTTPATSSEAAPRMVNSKQFELQYDVDASAGLPARIELWGTTTGGKQWQLVRTDEDRRSPVPVEVVAEGLYGFAIVVHAATGERGQAPVSGDPPEAQVRVDLTPPTARILGIEPVNGANPAEPRKLAIRWESTDKFPAERPATLSCAPAVDGPWQQIACDLDATGGYFWTPATESGGRALVRLEVRDAAGNIGSVTTSQAVPLAQRPLRGRILDAQPIRTTVR